MKKHGMPNAYIVKFGPGKYLVCDDICTLNSVRTVSSARDATVVPYRSTAVEFGDRAAYIFGKKNYEILSGDNALQIEHAERIREANVDSDEVLGVHKRHGTSSPIS